MQPAIVSTECPSCGAPLDFSEGSNAVRCSHCESQLLVTGRTQLLSYCIAPTVEARDAARAAAYECEAAGRPGRVRDATLWQIPYYRMTGHDLRWIWETSERDRREANDDTEARLWARVMPHGMAVDIPEPQQDQRRLALRERYIEKSFLACHGERLGLPVSLGFRPTVLRLRLFRPDSAGPRAQVMRPTLAPEQAWEIGLKAVGAGEAVYRRVLRRVLSLVYQPVWAVSVKTSGEETVLIDALTGKAIRCIDGRPNGDIMVADDEHANATVVGLRPLVCPNCGWAFPLEADEVLAPCPSCSRAYTIHGHELRSVSYRLADLPRRDGDGITHVPFWVLDVSLATQRRCMHIPAFRYRRLKFLVDLVRGVMAKAPEYGTVPPDQFTGRGAVYDEDDAAALAAFVLAASDPTSDRAARQLTRTPLEVHSANVVWVPFHLQRDALIDPFTGRAFNLMLLERV